MIIQLSKNVWVIGVCVETECENDPRADAPDGLADLKNHFKMFLLNFKMCHVRDITSRTMFC